MNHQPTDMMRRRASLPLRERFFWSRTPITICTNSNAVLNAAEQAGLIAHHGLEREHGLRWEIVVEREHIAADENWECKATLDAHSIYLTVGSYQWFAFDLETGLRYGCSRASAVEISEEKWTDSGFPQVAGAVSSCE